MSKNKAANGDYIDPDVLVVTPADAVFTDAALDALAELLVEDALGPTHDTESVIEDCEERK